MPDNREKIVNLRGVAQGLPTTPDIPNPSRFSPAFGGEPGLNMSPDDIWENALAKAPKNTRTAQIPLSSIYKGNRYKETLPGTDYEEMAANQQSASSKIGNDIIKFAGIAGTSFVSGTAGLVYGVGSAIKNQRWAGLLDNDVTRGMDNVMTSLEDIAPNYYTHAEQDAKWYSPDNILTVNFWSDKVFKNLGYSAGAIGGGVAWGSLLRGIGLTNKLVQAGRGLEAATAIEEAMATAPNLGKYAAFENTLNSIAQKYIKSPISSVLKDSDRILTSAMGTFGEASLEGLQGMNKFRKEAIEEFRSTHGYNPEGADLDQINKMTDDLGMHIWGANSLLLTATNYIQLPKILGSSRKADKALINKIDQEALGKEFTQALPKTTFGRITKRLGSATKSLATGKATVLFAPSEAFEEGMQFAIETGVNNYFMRAYKNRNSSKEILTNLNESWGNIVSEGIAETISSDEGMESILIGGLSGGIQQSGMVGTYKNEQGKTRIGFGKSGLIGEQGLFGDGGERQRNTEDALTALNKSNINKALKDQIKFMGIGIGSQKLRQAAIANNDLLSEKDYERDFALSYIMPRAKYGKVESVNQELDYYKSQAMDNNGFDQLVTSGIANEKETKEQFIERIESLKSVAKNVDDLYSKINDKYGDQYKDGEKLYSDDVVDRLVYAASKVKDYDDRIPGINESLIKNNIITQDVINDVLENDSTDTDSFRSALAQIMAMDVDNDTKEDLIRDLEDLSEVAVRRKAFIKEYNDILEKPTNYKDALIADTPDDTPTELLRLTEGQRVDQEGNVIDAKGNVVPKETIKIKTKKGERNIEIGTEYFLGKRVFEDSKGKEVYRTPKITILGENEDGTIKIKDAKGDIRDISKDELLDYSLAKVSSTLNNKTAKYYLEHMNSVFAFYGKKVTNEKGERVPVKGRLEYFQTEDGQKDKLFFVYKDEKGKIVKKEIDGSMVVPKKGYKHAILKHIGTLTPAQQKAEESFGKTTSSSLQAKLQRREETLNQLYEEVLEKKENTEKLISEKTAQLEKLKKQITDITDQIETNKNPEDKRFKKFTLKETIFDAISQLKVLSKMEQDLQQELEELYTVDDELKLNVEYVEQLIDNIEELPTSTKEFINELNDELIDLNILVEETGKQINTVSSLMDATRDAIKSAIKYLSGLIKNFESRYFNVPSPQGQEWVDFLKANPNFLKTKPNYKAELDALEVIIAETEDFNITPSEARLQDLEEHLDILNGAIKDYEKQIKIREDVLSKLEDIYKKALEKKQEEKELANNQALLQEFIGTLDNGIQPIASTSNSEKVYEQAAKKSDYDVLGGTRPVSNDRPHNLRANRFGSRFNSLSRSKKENIKGRIVTLKTEGLQGVPGLSNLIVDGEANPKDVIALVMVIMNEDGTYSLVDEFGDAFKTEEQFKNPLDHAVFQVFPGDSLQGKYSGKTESMFRNATAEDRKETINELTKQYREWRKEQLAKEELEYPKDFKTSFGIPEYVTMLVEKKVGDQIIQVEEINYNATTPVEKTGLVSSTDISNKKVIAFSTSDSVSEGSVTFKTGPGRVFLSLPGGLIKLNNRKLTKDEATTIYEAIYQLSKIAFDKKTIKDNDEAQQIVSWLKSVIYWGIAKNTQTGERKKAGYNNIWFEDITDDKGVKSTRLFISGLGGNMSFAPTEIFNRRNELITLISSLYHNVSGTKVNDNSWSVPYTQILGFDKNGEAIPRIWKNYQTYLLSSEGRKDGEIPLTTIVRPKQGENDVVRKGMYFTLNQTADTFNFELAKPAPVVQKENAPVTPAPVVTQPVVTPQQPSTISKTPSGIIQVDENSPLSSYKLDGKTPHTFKTKLGNVLVLIDEKGEPIYQTVAGIYDYDTLNTIAAVEKAFPQQDEVSTKAYAYNALLNKVRENVQRLILINSMPQDNAVTAAPVVETPVAQPVAPVSDIEAKKADIEKRRKDSIKSVYEEKGVKILGQQISSGGWLYKIDDGGTIGNKDGDALLYLFKTKEEALSNLNAKYDAELAALEEAKPVEEAPAATNNPFANRPKTNGVQGLNKKAFRFETYEQSRQFAPENFNKLEEWLTANFPNLPVYRVKNIIKTSNGRQAWGMLHKGAIYLYENAETGTAYHEVFEAVWAMMTSAQERINIAKDFRNREGSYIDRFTGETVVYKDATDDQMREELAEEFRDYVLYDKNPQQAPNPKTPSFLKKIFDWLINGIKTFFTGKDAAKNTQELFDRIGNGYYKSYIPFEQKLSFANVGYTDITEVIPDNSSVFRARIENLSATDIHQIMQQMTYTTITQMTRNNKSLFNITAIDRKKMYDIIKDDLLNNRIGRLADQVEIDIEKNRITQEQGDAYYNNIGTLYNNISNQWPLIQEKHEEYLLSYGIIFDENDEINYDDYEKSKDEGYGDPRQIDGFKKLNNTIKLLLSSLSESTFINGRTATDSTINNMGGVTLVPLGSVYVDLLNQLHNSVDQSDMINKFRKASRNNPNYVSLFERMFKVSPLSENPIDYTLLSKEDLRLIDGFWKTFKKQSPTVSALFILGNGDIVVGDSNTSGAVREYRRQFINSILEGARTGTSPYITKDKTKGFVRTPALTALNEQTDIAQLVNFLSNLGIEFSEKELKKSSYDVQKMFRNAANGIIRSLKERVTDTGIEKINVNTLDVSGRLLELGLVKSKLETSDFDTTYFNINGERSQTFLGPNLLSSFYDVISKVDKISDLANTNFGYLITDTYSNIGSVMLNRIFDENGDKREGLSLETLKPFIIDGTINEELGKNTESSRLTKRQRYLQELNMNLKGIYMNLVPGDANMQTAIKLHDSDNPFVTKDMLLSKGYMNIFKDQFISEVTMSREINRQVAKGRNNENLRFFKSILGESLHKKIVTKAQNTNVSPEEIYEDFKTEINDKVKEFIDTKTEKSLNKMKGYNIIKPSADGNYIVENVSIFNTDESYTIDAIRSTIKQQQMNFMIANVELHKLLYSDPFQYTDQLKRVKNFTSPRQILSYGNNEINSRYGELYNNDDAQDKLFNTNFNRDTINGGTISDILSDNEELEYTPFEETDGGGYITDKGNRYLSIKNGEWTDENEEQYIYDMAYMKKVLNKPLNAIEKERFKKGNPKEQSNYTPIKPIVAGNKNMGRSYNDVLLDKFSLFPISFRMIHELNPTANMLKLYEKMIDDNVDYVVYASGRKVGKENIYQLYDKDGNFNKAPLISKEEKKNPLGKQTVLTIPLSIFAIQTEVPTKENNKVTQGSQPTKLATMDFMEAGVPIDFMAEEEDFTTRYNEWIKLIDKGSYNEGNNLYNEIKNNQNLLEARIQDGLSSLFKELGITKVGDDKYTLSKPELTFDILKKELLKREINDNIVDALDGYEDGKFVLEAIPSYQQIRNILYSIAHRAVVSTKLKGGQKVQVSSALLESQRARAKEITDSKGNTKTIYESDILKFYTNKDGKRACQIMISRWFKSPLSDEELLNYFNNTEEGKKQLSALAGVAFRIPSQKQNSIEVFEIAKFLPEGYGDSVIVPSALVKKTGSDFDIDKLFIYLKNLYPSKDNALKVVPYFGIGEEAKKKLGELYDKGEFDEYTKFKKDLISREDAEGRMMAAIFAEEVGAGGKVDVINDLYRQSLDNAYVDSLGKLISHPLNFKNLVKPNSAEQLQKLTDDIETLLGTQKIDYSDVGEMLDREAMSELRNDFVRAKSAIGIAATSQTGNAQAQRGLLSIDRTKLNRVSQKDRAFLGDALIKFENFNSVKGMPSLSMIEDANALPEDRNYISDVIGQVIDGYVDAAKDPWVMRLGITPNVAGTWLFLIRTGVPLKDVAYFMNQPIIKEFLQTLENNGYSYVFNNKYINAVKEVYEYEAISADNVTVNTIPNVEELSGMIGKDETTLEPYQSLQQLFILDEFLKYSKMAEQLLTFTQATNFDTATFNDPFLIAKKLRQIEKARNTIFSDVDDFLDSSFIGELKNALNSFRDGIAEILLSDKRDNPNGQSIRGVLEQVLDPYMDMNDKDFVSTSKKAVLTLFDWAVQTDRNINTQLTKVLLSNDKGESTASELMKLKKAAEDPSNRLYNNYVLKALQLEKGNNENEPDNLYINAKATKVYDQNQIIYALREIKKLLPESQKPLYGNLVRLAVLQSGLSNSRISFTSLLPFEDFVEVYNQTLSKIDKLPNLSDFVDMNVFERGNWNDANIVDQHKERVILTKKGRYFKPETTMVSNKLKIAMNNGKIPKTINISANSMEANSDVITYIWSDMTVNKDTKKEMVKKGDYSFMKKGLFKKVYSKNKKGISSPIVYETISTDKKTGKTTVYKNYVYKMINAWGDSLYAKEFYNKKYPSISKSTVSQASVFDNGYEKVVEKTVTTVVAGLDFTKKQSPEVEDNVVVEILGKSAYVEGDEFIFLSEEESLPLQEQNSPEGLPSINRTNKKC
jgi:hypothetical protein